MGLMSDRVKLPIETLRRLFRLEHINRLKWLTVGLSSNQFLDSLRLLKSLKALLRPCEGFNRIFVHFNTFLS
jgi:hypothetical protein